MSSEAEEEEGNTFKHCTYGSNSGSTCFISLDTFPRWSSIGNATTEFCCGPGSLMKFLAFVCSRKEALMRQGIESNTVLKTGVQQWFQWSQISLASETPFSQKPASWATLNHFYIGQGRWKSVNPTYCKQNEEIAQWEGTLQLWLFFFNIFYLFLVSFFFFF